MPGARSCEFGVVSRESGVAGSRVFAQGRLFKNLKGERSEQAAVTKWPGSGVASFERRVGSREFARSCARVFFYESCNAGLKTRRNWP